MTKISKELALQIAQAVCGDDHLMCSWPSCGCKATKRKINAVAKVIADAEVNIEVVEFTASVPNDGAKK